MVVALKAQRTAQGTPISQTIRKIRPRKVRNKNYRNKGFSFSNNSNVQSK